MIEDLGRCRSWRLGARSPGRLVNSPHCPTSYGYGWVIEPTEHGQLIWHDGGNLYFYAGFTRYIEAGVAVFVVTNAWDGYAGNQDLARDLAALLLASP